MATPDTAEAATAAAAPPAEEPPKEVKSEEPVEEVKAEEPAASVAPESAEAPVENAGEAPPATEEASAAEAEKDVAATGPVEPGLPSFKEESYFEKDLKESEKKALQEFCEKVEAAIKASEFVLPPKVEVVRETEITQATEEGLVVVTATEKEIKEGDVEVKTEEVVMTVIASEEPPLEGSAEPPPTAPEAQAPEVRAVESEAPPAEVKTSEDKSAAPVETAPAEVKISEDKSAESEAPAAVSETPAEGSSSQEVATETPEAAPVVETRETVNEEKDLAPPEDLELWGVPLLPSKGDPRTKVIFLKFLRARDFKLKDAFAMLKSTIFWRKKYGADKILEEDLGTDFDVSAFNHGVDKDGHPVQYNVFGAFQDRDFYQKVFGDSAKTEKALRWRVQLLEKQIKLLNFNPGGVTSILQIVDLKNTPWLGKKGLWQFTTQALSLLQDNYPELVVKIVFLNVPWYYNAIYTFISPFLTQRQKSKFVTGSSLFKFISPDNIPVQYGGLSRVNDAEFGDANAPMTELVLKAGEKQTVDIDVTAAGATVVWDVAIIGADVTYAAEFVPNKEGGYTTIVEKPKKVTLLEEPIRNSFKSPEPGKLVLSVDNTSSRKKKTVIYRYITKTPDVAAE